MVTHADGGEESEGLSALDAALLRSVAEIAAKGDAPAELRTLAQAVIGVIQMQAEMAQLFSQFVQQMADDRKPTDDG